MIFFMSLPSTLRASDTHPVRGDGSNRRYPKTKKR